MGQRASRSGGGCLRAKRNGKWIWEFHLKISNMQNHRIPYSTATWSMMEDALEPAPFLSVVGNRNGKWTRIFASFERQSLQKAHKNQNHRILYSTATWGSVPVAPAAAACVRTAMVNGFEILTQNFQTCKIMKYPILRPHGALWKTLRSRRLFYQ